MRPTTRSMTTVGALTLGLGLGLGASPAHAQNARPGIMTTPAVSRAATNGGWAGYAPATAWYGYAPGPVWRTYVPVYRVSAAPMVSYRPSAYRELGTGRNVLLAKPWLPASP